MQSGLGRQKEGRLRKVVKIEITEVSSPHYMRRASSLGLGLLGVGRSNSWLSHKNNIFALRQLIKLSPVNTISGGKHWMFKQLHRFKLSVKLSRDPTPSEQHSDRMRYSVGRFLKYITSVPQLACMQYKLVCCCGRKADCQQRNVQVNRSQVCTTAAFRCHFERVQRLCSHFSKALVVHTSMAAQFGSNFPPESTSFKVLHFWAP